jgi:hypothetical protein
MTSILLSCCVCCHDRYNHRTGEYAHTTRLTKFPERKWLTSFDLLTAPTADPAPLPIASDEVAMFAKMFAAAEKEADRIWADNSSKLKKSGSATVFGTGAGAGAGSGAPSGYEEVRWFIVVSDFPHSLPSIAPSAGTGTITDISLRVPLKGKYK